MPQETKDELTCVKDLFNGKFFIPGYQRGYRWNDTQAIRLIEDLFEFSEKAGASEFYCLQPLVTMPVDKEKHPEYEGYTEVIDGQQRLTTLLLLLQAIHTLMTKKEDSEAEVKIFPGHYKIQYETRWPSETWLNKIKLVTSTNSPEAIELINDNCDYYHLVEVYVAIYQCLNDKDYYELDNLRSLIHRRVKFIPYTPAVTENSNNDIFDDINAGRIDLNNAELVKALLVQDSNLGEKPELEHRINAIALQWDAVERRLNDKEFWGFVYSAENHPFDYETRIEYLLDLISGKTEYNRDYEYFTFDFINERYKAADDKLKFAEDTWQEIKNLFDTLEEWYDRRHLYHRIGYLLEFGEKVTVMTLKKSLKGLKKDEQLSHLNLLIENSLEKISSYSLFHGNKELSQVLYLFNILVEDQRISSTARFSFADYRNVKREKHGWDQEHVASNTDAKIKNNEHKDFVRDMIEYFTGVKPSIDKEITISAEELNEHIGDLELADLLINVGNSETYDEEKREQLLNDVFAYFDRQNDKALSADFDEDAKLKSGRTANEKNFIWNFVLLNAVTNRSYGNSFFPVKRKRILNDEFDVYTPVGTRNVFEKAYSRKLVNMMSWTRDDAKAYWQEICRVLKPYKTFEFPFKSF